MKSRFLLIATSLIALSASAQWQWLDQNGRRVFSDRAPPLDVPEKNIRLRPNASAEGVRQAQASGAVSATSAPPRTSRSAKLTELELSLTKNKKNAELAQEAQRRAQAQRLQAQRSGNCERARQAKMAVDSGQRLSVFNTRGEREFIDDQSRAAQAARLQSIIQENCD